MKCYYRIDDGPWIKGEIDSMHGGTQVNFHSRADTEKWTGAVVHQVTLTSSPEVLFHGPWMSVTGFVVAGEKDNRNLYQLVSVDVSGGWVKPKERNG